MAILGGGFISAQNPHQGTDETQVLVPCKHCLMHTSTCPSISVKFPGPNVKPLIWVAKSCTHIFCASLEYKSTFRSINAVIFRVLLSNTAVGHEETLSVVFVRLCFPSKKAEQGHKGKATEVVVLETMRTFFPKN